MDAASLSVPRWLRCAEHAPAQLAAGETLLLPVRTAASRLAGGGSDVFQLGALRATGRPARP